MYLIAIITLIINFFFFLLGYGEILITDANLILNVVMFV